VRIKDASNYHVATVDEGGHVLTVASNVMSPVQHLLLSIIGGAIGGLVVIAAMMMFGAL